MMVMPLLRFKRDEGSNYPEWKEDTLKGLGTFIRGLSYSANLETDDTSKTLVLRANNIISDGFVDLKNNVKYVDKIPKNEQILLKGDIAIATTSSPGIVGKTALYNSVYEGNITVGAFCCIYRSCNPIMPYVLRSPRYKYLSNISMADSVGGFRNLYISNLEAMTFFVPSSLEEQQKIADFLSDIDNQIENYQQSLDNLESQKKELLRQVFSQEVRFKQGDGNDYPDWEEYDFFNIVDNLIDFRGRTPKKLYLDWADTKTEFVALSAKNVKQGYIDFSVTEHYGTRELYNKWMQGNELHKGQILFTTEAPTGNVCLIPDNKPYILSQRVIAIDVKRNICCNEYISWALRSPMVQKFWIKMSTGTTAKGVGQKHLKELKIAIPKSFEEQQKIADFFTDFDNRIALERQRLQTMQEIKKGLLQQMFC